MVIRNWLSSRGLIPIRRIDVPALFCFMTSEVILGLNLQKGILVVPVRRHLVCPEEVVVSMIFF